MTCPRWTAYVNTTEECEEVEEEEFFVQWNGNDNDGGIVIAESELELPSAYINFFSGINSITVQLTYYVLGLDAEDVADFYNLNNELFIYEDGIVENGTVTSIETVYEVDDFRFVTTLEATRVNHELAWYFQAYIIGQPPSTTTYNIPITYFKVLINEVEFLDGSVPASTTNAE